MAPRCPTPWWAPSWSIAPAWSSARGIHERAGQPHAEVVALDAAGDPRAGGHVVRDARAMLSRRPDRSRARSGFWPLAIARVVAATLDPFPRVAGQGVRELREAGVVVEVGLEEAAARRLNAAYLMVQERQRPLIVLKAATTRDGRIAARRDRAHRDFRHGRRPPHAASARIGRRDCRRRRHRTAPTIRGSPRATWCGRGP